MEIMELVLESERLIVLGVQCIVLGRDQGSK